MTHDKTHLMGDFNDALDEVRTSIYRLLEFGEDDFSEKKNLAKREVLYQINELRIKMENL